MPFALGPRRIERDRFIPVKRARRVGTGAAFTLDPGRNMAFDGLSAWEKEARDRPSGRGVLRDAETVIRLLSHYSIGDKPSRTEKGFVS